MKMDVLSHTPVLLPEVIEALQVQPGGKYVDCTVGGGGHAVATLESGGQLLGIDADPAAIEKSEERLRTYKDNVILVNENFKHLKDICTRYGFYPVNGVLFDLGMSSFQIEEDGRGFSFRHDAPLDMRFNPSQELTAADIVNNFPEPELARILEKYGEEKKSRRIAHHIVRNRPLRTTLELAQIVKSAVKKTSGRIHPATKTFQALRIVVNCELENLEQALPQAIEVLIPSGRLAVISFHSLEDRIVKEFFRLESRGCICSPEMPICTCNHKPTLKIVNKKVITPSIGEVKFNPRSRSAKLRVAECMLRNIP